MSKVNNVVKIPTSLDGKFFTYWLLFLRPFHNLTDREIQVTASLLKHRYELSKVISDEAILDQVTLGDDTKKKVMEDCCIQLPHLLVFLTKLKQKNIICEGRINPKFIPNITDNGVFSLLLYFELNDGAKKPNS